MPKHTLNSEIVTILNKINELADLASYNDGKYTILNEDNYYRLVDEDGIALCNGMKGVKFLYFLRGFILAQGIYV